MSGFVLFLSVAIAFGPATVHASESPSSHPNLVLVLVDPMRGQALGFLHEDPVLTPRLERTRDPWLASERGTSPSKE